MDSIDVSGSSAFASIATGRSSKAMRVAPEMTDGEQLVFG